MDWISETSNSIKVLRNQKSLVNLDCHFYLLHETTPGRPLVSILDLHQRWKMKNLRIWTVIWTFFIKLLQAGLWYPFWIFSRSCDSKDIDENEIDDHWETLEGEQCQVCDQKFRTGWNLKLHIKGKHLLRTFWTRWTIYYFFLVFYIFVYSSNLPFVIWVAFRVWSWIEIIWN